MCVCVFVCLFFLMREQGPASDCMAYGRRAFVWPHICVFVCVCAGSIMLVTPVNTLSCGVDFCRQLVLFVLDVCPEMCCQRKTLSSVGVNPHSPAAT